MIRLSRRVGSQPEEQSLKGKRYDKFSPPFVFTLADIQKLGYYLDFSYYNKSFTDLVIVSMLHWGYANALTHGGPFVKPLNDEMVV